MNKSPEAASRAPSPKITLTRERHHLRSSPTHLVLGEPSGQAPYEDLIRPILHLGADHSQGRQVHGGAGQHGAQ
eukprot:1159367-Pelagomonas_calceolata.AAC.4